MVHPVVSKIDHDQCSSAQRLFVESAFDLYKQLSGISREVVSEFVDTLEANPTAYARLAMFASSAPSAITFIDERDYGMDMVDFGDNGPVWISGIHQQMPNLIALFKQPPPMDNGVAMFACLRSEIVEQLISDPFFSRYAELF
ncbi:hypothetical protein LPJ73_003039 [Coemansia sp. RSA 2703]|nr:hypothetical protein LPJ73_003039 [Coemansia sp. RSA 2703]